MEFIYQIKIASNDYNAFCRPVLAQGILDVEKKADVLAYVEKEYPEYFDGNKVAQKLSRKSEQIVYVSIFELDGYWKNYWTQEVECAICHKKVPLIQVKNQLGGFVSKFICSMKCEEKRKELAENEYEEYWNERSECYYIYKITNKNNGKVYVGYTEREPLFRWWEHFKHSNFPIGKALKEDGIESFTFEVLEKHLKSDKTVVEMHEIETKYIQLFDSINSGYNCIVSKKQDYEYCGSVV